jgi:carbon monoxide dehydrogenase subunit G
VAGTDSILIQAPPDHVWEVLADWRRYAEWMPDVAWVRLRGPERDVGLELDVKTKVFGLVPLVTDRIRVTAWEPPRRMAVAHLGLVYGAAEWRLEPAEGGTRFWWREDVHMRPGRLGDLALTVYWPFQRMLFRRSMRNVRRRAEANR